jgi:hypothetical protein
MKILVLKVKVKKISPITGLERPRGFQEVEAPRFHMKVVRMSDLAPAAFTLEEIFLILISVRD